jgi:hypothetical protein
MPNQEMPKKQIIALLGGSEMSNHDKTIFGHSKETHSCKLVALKATQVYHASISLQSF